MNRITLIGIIVLMTISLLGVVGMQLYWITDAIKVKQAQFDHGVHDALTKVVAKLETREAVSVVTGQMASFEEASATDQIEATGTNIPSPAQYPAKARAQTNPKPQGENSKTIAAAKIKPAESAVGVAHSNASNPMRVSKPNHRHQTRGIGRDSVFYYRIGDSRELIPREALAGNTILRGSQILSAASLPDSVMLLKNLNELHALRLLRIPDTLTFRASASQHLTVNSLIQVMGQLDSLKVSYRKALNIHPNSIASINVTRDSIIIFRNAELAGRRIESKPPAAVKVPSQNPNGSVYEAPEKETKLLPAKMASSQAQPIPWVDPVPEKVEAKKEKLNEVVKKMVVEYVAKDVPLRERLNLHNLQSLLQTELAENGINLDFGFWVISGKADTVAVQNVQQASLAVLPNYKVSLFPNDVFEKPDYLAIYFPQSQTYALKSLWFMLLCSAFFTLVIIITFSTTIHIILKQKKLSEMKNDFINNMTHEFKTPIATISLATDSIANPRIFENPEKIKYYTNIIREENKRMNVQVENVLQIARLEKNEFRMTLQPVDVHELIQRAVERIKLQVEKRMGTISAQMDALHYELKSDEVHLYNVICNLLDNANKYSPNSPDIRLYTRNVAGGILIAVEDKGLGMSKDTQQRVFEEFYRVPTGNLHNVKGFGLGLSYVKAIVQAHHGQIKLKSELGKGSRFEIFLPFQE